MRQQPAASMAWIVKLIVVVVIIGAVVGLALAGTDIVNPFTRIADARAKDQVTATQAQRDAIDIRARQQVADLQVAKNVIEQQVYQLQQLAQAEAGRQQQLAQLELQRERDLSEIRTREQAQAQALADQAARAEQDVKTAASFSSAAALSIVIIASAFAVTFIFSAVILTWSRLQRARYEPAMVKTADSAHRARTASPAPTAHSHAVPATATEPTVATAARFVSEREYWRQRREEARQRELNDLAAYASQNQLSIGYNPSAQTIGTRFSKAGEQPTVASEPERTIEPNNQLS